MGGETDWTLSDRRLPAAGQTEDVWVLCQITAKIIVQLVKASLVRLQGLRTRNAKPHACFQNVTRSITLIFPVINLPFSMSCYSRRRFTASPKLLSPELDAELGLL